MPKCALGPEWRVFVRRSFPILALTAALLVQCGGAQLFKRHPKDNKQAEEHKPEYPPSQQPAFSIPVEPLGFFAPGAIYQGQRESMVSLDFLDEGHLLFTFHAPGLIRRQGNPTAANERQIRAVLLNLPGGAVESEALWAVHDRDRYLWMLNDGHFLLRDRGDLKLGDSSLDLSPLFHFRGPLLWLELDPAQNLLVTDSREPAELKAKPSDVSSPPSASTRMSVDQNSSSPSGRDNIPPDALANASPDVVVRILRRQTGQVMLMSRTRKTVHLPVNSDGWVETLRGNGHEWVINLKFFRGGSRIIGKIDSMCTPSVEFVSNPEVLVTACNPDQSRWIAAISTDGKRLWNTSKPGTQIWPRLIMAPNGLRFARETLLATHTVDTIDPLSFDDVKAQWVEVYDASTGKAVLTAPASPILDGGGNVAISPSARRVAILDQGAIRVYELPAPSPGP
ncbi:hypothetical protein [Occallatibacter savannae]|uniref:hypothetical protein n=1 Tax=Occallatibacter savannae TaxID=1002691 RepID=UPI000D68F7B9|nr:hypothetical protein [Occallatibacter savannae]